MTGHKHFGGRVVATQETTRLGAIIMGRGRGLVLVISASKFSSSTSRLHSGLGLASALITLQDGKAIDRQNL